MKYKYLFLIIFLFSCQSNYTKLSDKAPYTSKGFAYIYNDEDRLRKVIKGKLDNLKFQVSIQDLKTNTLVKLTNPYTEDYIVIKNLKKIKYPDFYRILITEEVAKKINLNKKLPLVEILELKKNKSFVAKKAKIFKEEKKIPSNAPVTSVKISNISKNKSTEKKINKDKLFIHIASFYSKETAIFLKKRIAIEIPTYDQKKLIISKKSDKKIDLISGPYSTINLVKNDYTLLKNFGFEELDISTYE